MPDSTLKLLTKDDIRDLIVCDPITKKGKTALEHLGLANIITVDSYFGENDSSKSIYVSSKLYPVKRTRERVAFKPTSPVYGR